MEELLCQACPLAGQSPGFAEVADADTVSMEHPGEQAIPHVPGRPATLDQLPHLPLQAKQSTSASLRCLWAEPNRTATIVDVGQVREMISPLRHPVR